MGDLLNLFLAGGVNEPGVDGLFAFWVFFFFLEVTEEQCNKKKLRN